MTTRMEKARLFRRLHIPGDPLVLFNIWDPGSASALADVGSQAIATGSASVAMASGFADGEQTPLELVLDNISRIVNAVELPVSLDLEGCYGSDPAEVAATVDKAMATGIAGFNFEDQVIGGEGLYTLESQQARIAAARAAVDRAGVEGFINARTDIFLKSRDPATHTESMLDEAVERAKAYAEAGADGIFVPGLAGEDLIGRLCQDISLPVNILAFPHVPGKARLAELGVARISHGPLPYRQMIATLQQAAKNAMD